MSTNSEDTDAIEYGERLARSLKQAIDEVKVRAADRDDVVVELREFDGARLELLADELRPLMNEIDETDTRFDFGLSRGEKPRLWIDMTSFVAMGHNKRGYRFIKDTRMGRHVLAECDEMEKMADIVSEYVAEKVLERERMIEGEWVSLKEKPAGSNKANEKTMVTAQPKKQKSAWRSFMWFLMGIIFTLGAVALGMVYLLP